MNVTVEHVIEDCKALHFLFLWWDHNWLLVDHDASIITHYLKNFLFLYTTGSFIMRNTKLGKTWTMMLWCHFLSPFNKNNCQWKISTDIKPYLSEINQHIQKSFVGCQIPSFHKKMNFVVCSHILDFGYLPTSKYASKMVKYEQKQEFYQNSHFFYHFVQTCAGIG